MKCYIFSDLLAHVKINGEYKGVVNDNLFIIDSPSDKPFFEFLPATNKFSIVYGDKSHKNLKIFHVGDSLLVYPIFPLKNDSPFKIIDQKSKSSYGVTANVTVLVDGAVKFFLDGSVSDVKLLPFTPNTFEISLFSNYVMLTFTLDKTAIFIYSIESRNLVFSDLVDEFYLSDYLTVKKTYKTVTHTFIERDWALGETPSIVATRDLKGKSFFEINFNLLPLAFFENLIIGGSVNEIVTPALNDRLLDLKEFLGKVIKVIPSPDGKIWLIKEDMVTLAVIKYENRLISNVLTEDYNCC